MTTCMFCGMVKETKKAQVRDANGYSVKLVSLDACKECCTINADVVVVSPWKSIQWRNEFTCSQVATALHNALAFNLPDIHYPVYNQEGDEETQVITTAEAAEIVKYLESRPDVHYVGKDGAAPMFRHVLESIPWTKG